MKYSEFKLPSNHKFGYFFSFIFFSSGIYFFLYNNIFFSYLFFILCFIFLIITRIKPNLLLPLNKLWMRLGFLLGYFISPIVLGIIYFGLFTSIGLIMKFFGRDELVLKMVNKETYWRDRSTDELYLISFKNQF